MIPPSWPFAVWGVDILGPFPRAVGEYRFLYVAIDKFTKWPEVTPVVNITKKSAVASRVLLTNPCRSSCGVTTWTSLTSEGGEQQSEMHSTTRRSGAIINGSCTVGSSGLATSSSDGS